MDALVNDTQTYEDLKRDPTPALQWKLNSTLLTLKKANAIDTQSYNRLRCSIPKPQKLYGQPKIHKPGFPMRLIVFLYGSPTYQLSKYLTTILQPLTDKSRRKLQSTEDFINATKTVQIPDDYKLVSFDVKSLFSRDISRLKRFDFKNTNFESLKQVLLLTPLSNGSHSVNSIEDFHSLWDFWTLFLLL